MPLVASARGPNALLLASVLRLEFSDRDLRVAGNDIFPARAHSTPASEFGARRAAAARVPCERRLNILEPRSIYSISAFDKAALGGFGAETGNAFAQPQTCRERPRCGTLPM